MQRRLEAPIRAMTGADLSHVARLHVEALEAGFFGRLGHRFLRRYYQTFAESPFAVAVVVGDPPEAMLVGTIHNELHYRWVLKHRGLRLAVSGGLALSVRPRVLFDFVRTRLTRYARSLKRASAPPAGEATSTSSAREQVAVLAHVAVSERARRKGLGAALVNAFVTAACSGEADRALLVTLEESKGAHDFYLSLGWDPIGSKTDKDGRPLTMFQLKLKDAS